MKINNKKITINRTMSSVYFLPIVNQSLSLKFLPQLRNSYLRNNKEDKEFCVLYKFIGTKEFLKYEEELFEHKLFIGHEDHDEYVLYKFRIPDEYLKYRALMFEGKCSGFEEKIKKAIVLFARRRLFEDVDTINDLIRGEGEIPIPNIQEETFSFWVEEEKSFLNANDLYKKRKSNE